MTESYCTNVTSEIMTVGPLSALVMPPTQVCPRIKGANFPFQGDLSTHVSCSDVLLFSATVKYFNLQSLRGTITTEIAFKQSLYVQGL